MIKRFYSKHFSENTNVEEWAPECNLLKLQPSLRLYKLGRAEWPVTSQPTSPVGIRFSAKDPSWGTANNNVGLTSRVCADDSTWFIKAFSVTMQICCSAAVISEDVPPLCHYVVDYQPAVHLTVFSVVCVNMRTQRRDLCVFSSSYFSSDHLNMALMEKKELSGQKYQEHLLLGTFLSGTWTGTGFPSQRLTS